VHGTSCDALCGCLHVVRRLPRLAGFGVIGPHVSCRIIRGESHGPLYILTHTEALSVHPSAASLSFLVYTIVSSLFPVFQLCTVS